MRNVSLDMVKQAVRARVCSRCSQRTHGCENLQPDAPLPCERTCSVFLNLPRLVYVAERLDPLIGSTGRALAHAMDNHTCACAHATSRACHASGSAKCGTIGVDRRPLRRHGQRVIMLIKQMLRA
jgi:hypothetical protein